MFPDNPYDTYVPVMDGPTFHHLTIDEPRDIFIEKLYFVLYGQATYIDIFGVSHWVRTCQMRTYGGPRPYVSTARCAAYNDADNNSSK